MKVRGAPLIAIVAALGLAVDTNSKMATFLSVQEAESFLLSSMATLRESRPTAVNLFLATDELRWVASCSQRL
jgi:methylthioribose-1-phosphate isomerase